MYRSIVLWTPCGIVLYCMVSYSSIYIAALNSSGQNVHIFVQYNIVS